MWMLKWSAVSGEGTVHKGNKRGTWHFSGDGVLEMACFLSASARFCGVYQGLLALLRQLIVCLKEKRCVHNDTVVPIALASICSSNCQDPGKESFKKRE